MQTMKLQGGRRTSPAAGAENRTFYNCNQCEFISTVKNEIDRHIKSEHEQLKKMPILSVWLQQSEYIKKTYKY